MSLTYTTNFALCPANSSNPFRIDPLAKTSIFTGVKTREYPNLELIFGFLNHNLGISFQNIARYKCVPYKTEQNQLTAYLGLLDKDAGCIVTRWSLPAHGWGRIMPDRHLSLSVMHRPTRHALCEGKYLDFDIENCHPAFLLDLVRRESTRSELSCANLAEYVADPKAIRAQIMAHYGVVKDVAKSLPIRLINGGSIKQWKLENGVSLQTDLPLIEGLEKELKPIIEAVWRDNQQIHVDISNAKQDKSDQYVTKSLKAKKRTIMGTWAQTIERCIQERAIASILDEYGIQLEDIVPCQDGYMPKICYAPYADEIIRKMEGYVHKELEISVKWVLKPFDEADRRIPAESELGLSHSITARMVADDNEASDMVRADLAKVLLADGNGRLWIKRNNIWTGDPLVIEDSVKLHILKSGISLRGTDKKGNDKPLPYTQNVSACKRVTEAVLLKARLEGGVHDLYDKFHSTTKGRLCFVDGVLDMAAKRFYKWDEIVFEYYSTVQIPFSFGDYYSAPNRADMAAVDEAVFQTLFGTNVRGAKHYLSRALAGHNEDKKWATYLGERDCGKGVLFDCLKNAFGDYLTDFELLNIMYERKRDLAEVSRKNYWMLPLEWARIAISQEIPENPNLKADAQMIKGICSGGDTKRARRNFDRVDTVFKIGASLMIMGNNELLVDEADAFQHCVQFRSSIQFKSPEFIQSIREMYPDQPELVSQYKVKDDSIKTIKVHSDVWKRATIMLMVEAYQSRAVEVDFKMDEDEVCGETSLGIRLDLLAKFVVARDETDMIPVKDLHEFIPRWSKKKVVGALEQLGVRKTTPTKGEYRRVAVYIGLVYKTENEETSEESKE